MRAPVGYSALSTNLTRTGKRRRRQSQRVIIIGSIVLAIAVAIGIRALPEDGLGVVGDVGGSLLSGLNERISGLIKPPSAEEVSPREVNTVAPRVVRDAPVDRAVDAPLPGHAGERPAVTERTGVSSDPARDRIRTTEEDTLRAGLPSMAVIPDTTPEPEVLKSARTPALSAFAQAETRRPEGEHISTRSLAALDAAADVGSLGLLPFATSAGDPTAIQANSPVLRGPAVAALPVPDPAILFVERGLASMAFDPGKVDGFGDADTAAAVALFQGFAGLPETGLIDDAFVEELRLTLEAMGLPSPAE